MDDDGPDLPWNLKLRLLSDVIIIFCEKYGACSSTAYDTQAFRFANQLGDRPELLWFSCYPQH